MKRHISVHVYGRPCINEGFSSLLLCRFNHILLQDKWILLSLCVQRRLDRQEWVDSLSSARCRFRSRSSSMTRPSCRVHPTVWSNAYMFLVVWSLVLRHSVQADGKRNQGRRWLSSLRDSRVRGTPHWYLYMWSGDCPIVKPCVVHITATRSRRSPRRGLPACNIASSGSGVHSRMRVPKKDLRSYARTHYVALDAGAGEVFSCIKCEEETYYRVPAE